MAAPGKDHSLSQTASSSKKKTPMVYSQHLDKTVRANPSQIVYGKEPMQLPDGVNKVCNSFTLAYL